jgi:hypothetical protein
VERAGVVGLEDAGISELPIRSAPDVVGHVEDEAAVDHAARVIVAGVIIARLEKHRAKAGELSVHDAKRVDFGGAGRAVPGRQLQRVAVADGVDEVAFDEHLVVPDVLIQSVGACDAHRVGDDRLRAGDVDGVEATLAEDDERAADVLDDAAFVDAVLLVVGDVRVVDLGVARVVIVAGGGRRRGVRAVGIRAPLRHVFLLLGDRSEVAVELLLGPERRDASRLDLVVGRRGSMAAPASARASGIGTSGGDGRGE